ncbi:MAG: bifunctional riboflavin kinase/FAD synthetase [Bacteroidales bacterium]
MRIFEIDNVSGIKSPVVTMGAFDGVHRGHTMLLARLREKARELGGESVVVTFRPHPKLVLGKFSSNISLLTSNEEKLFLLREAGIDNTVILDFNDELIQMEACEFIEKVLAGRLGMKHLVVGFNHRFGRGGSGDFSEISECSGRFGFGVERVGSLETNRGVISSTGIREALAGGDLAGANEMLGYIYFLRGTIVAGRQLGRSIGFPTANVSPDFPFKILPGVGVYAVTVRFNGNQFGGMANIGFRPTFNEISAPKSVEVHIFNFDQQIYGQSVTLSFHHRLRDEMKFSSAEDLRQQLIADKKEAERVLKGI